MTSATERIRALLDERGVEWSATVGANGTIWTHWDAFNGQRIHAMDNEDGTVEIFDQWNLTPAQAIAATLGLGTCKNTAPSYLDFLCSECGFVHYHSDENDSGDGNEWHFCPNCGRRIVGSTTNDVDAEVTDG